MDSDACPHFGVRLGRREHIVPFAFACRDVEHRRDAPLPCACQHLALLLGEPLVIEVAVRIDEHYAPPSPSPSGNSRRGKIGTGWPTARSEEHTSELQSLMRISYAVFCLKKKKQ